MDLLAQYSDDEDGDHAEEKPQPLAVGAAPKALARKPIAGVDEAMLPWVDAAPDVDLLGTSEVQNFAIAPMEKKMLTNPSCAALNKPLLGPLQAGQHSHEEKYHTRKIGHVEKAHVSKFSFDEQYLQFHNFGHAANPARQFDPHQATVVSTEVTKQGMDTGQTIWDKAPKRRRGNDKGAIKDEQAKVEGGDAVVPAVEDDKWGGFVDESVVRRELEEEVKAREMEVTRQQEEERAVEGEERETKERVTSVFHGSKESDYAGRSWIENKVKPPKDIDDRQCFLPKKWVYTWSGHTMGVQQIKLFPETAHLLLSAGMDGTVKIWDYHNQRKCLRTYMGHDQGVRDIAFTSDGRRFYSVSYDKNVQYWDTETGQVISTFTNKKTPFCVSVHPDPSMQNIILTGCSNKKAVQWDTNTANIVQEYDEHLGAVNTATFCDGGKRILTTSDDKKIFLWEFGIPVVVKYISEPSMHSVPAVNVSPNGKHLIGQSMDNKIITYEAFKSFKFIAKKQFKGHLNSGYAITPAFSSDGRWVMSGDVDGKLWFWDWQKCKNFRVLKAHDGVCISAIWHPSGTSRVITCGWDGQIKLWD